MNVYPMCVFIPLMDNETQHVIMYAVSQQQWDLFKRYKLFKHEIIRNTLDSDTIDSMCVYTKVYDANK